MWAGPLATWLLGRLGATVHKIEPAVRVDGLRALDGRGIYPGGRHTKPGEDSALFNALNGDKRRVGLDLRDPADHERFLTLARASDVVIDSFSPRVMPNFGLGPDVLGQGRSAPLLVSMPAFPPGALRNWVAYGTGVHALSGLGQVGPGRFSEPAVTYPDVVAGFTAAFGVVAAVVGRDRGRSPGRLEVPLLDATLPLLAFPNAGSVAGRDARAGATLFGAGRFVEATVAGAPVMHPVGPFGVGGAP
jgi:crotonobetainyl-CoA:carnitine CoA-transferase CaiB-like acyl-CoA transferase